jgi:hypothetical protein
MLGAATALITGAGAPSEAAGVEVADVERAAPEGAMASGGGSQASAAGARSQRRRWARAMIR